MTYNSLTLAVSLLVILGIILCYTKFSSSPNKLLVTSIKEDLSSTDPEVLVDNFVARVSSKLLKYAEENKNLGRLNNILVKFIRTQYVKKYLVKLMVADAEKNAQ